MRFFFVVIVNNLPFNYSQYFDRLPCLSVLTFAFHPLLFKFMQLLSLALAPPCHLSPSNKSPTSLRIIQLITLTKNDCLSCLSLICRWYLRVCPAPKNLIKRTWLMWKIHAALFKMWQLSPCYSASTMWISLECATAETYSNVWTCPWTIVGDNQCECDPSSAVTTHSLAAVKLLVLRHALFLSCCIPQATP